MEEPTIRNGIIYMPRIVTPKQALFYNIVWYEAYKSKQPIEKCLLKQLKRDIFDTKQIETMDDLSPLYVRFLRDHLYIELQFMKPLAVINDDDVELNFVYLLEIALGHLEYLISNF